MPDSCSKCKDPQSYFDELLFGTHYCVDGERIPPEEVVIELNGDLRRVTQEELEISRW